MTDPNSAWSRARRILAEILAPAPDPGEAWCVDCELNGYRTVVLSADGYLDHVRQHEGHDGYVSVNVKWPVTRTDDR